MVAGDCEMHEKCIYIITQPPPGEAISYQHLYSAEYTQDKVLLK